MDAILKSARLCLLQCWIKIKISDLKLGRSEKRSIYKNIQCWIQSMENGTYWRVQIPCQHALGMCWLFSVWSYTMDKLQLPGRNLGRVFNSRSSCVRSAQLRCFETKLPNLMLKTWPRQLLGSLPIDIMLSGSTNYGQTEKMSSKLKWCYKLGAASTKDVRCNIKAKNGPFWKVQKPNSWFLGRCDTQHKDFQHN